jgi:hypothetical protein
VLESAWSADREFSTELENVGKRDGNQHTIYVWNHWIQADYLLGLAPAFMGFIKCFCFTDVHLHNGFRYTVSFLQMKIKVNTSKT